MDEALEVHLRSLADGLYLLQRKGALKDNSREAAILQEFCPLGGHVAYLCRGVQLHGEVHLAVGHVLHDKGIYAHIYESACEGLCLLEFALVEDGVERHKDLNAKEMGIVHHASDVVGGVRSATAGTEALGTDV